MYICIMYIYACIYSMCICMGICMGICICSMCICMGICIYIYMHEHVCVCHTRTHISGIVSAITVYMI